MFGGDSLSDRRVHENTLRENIVADTIGDADGELTVPLEGSWLDLDEQPVSEDPVLGPFESVVLVRE